MTDRRSQQQATANDETAADERIASALKDVHTSLPGVIVSFNKDKQTAQVQPLIKRIFYEKGAVNLPVCVDVPVHFPKAGGFCITMPVKAGDECFLCFFERAIDNWFANGGVQEPSEYRLHDYSDGYAIVGLSNSRESIVNFNATDVEIRSLDRATRIQMKPDGTIINTNAGGSTTLSPAGKFTIVAPGGFEVVAPNTTMSGNLAVTAHTTVGGTAAVTGITTLAAVTSNGKNIGNTHTHRDTQPAVNQTSGPPT